MTPDRRSYILIDDLMPEHPRVIGLPDRAYVQLLTLWQKSAGGVVAQGSYLPDALLRAGLVDQDGTLYGWGTLWRGPYLHGGRPSIPVAIRRAVLERDGHACVLCFATAPLHLDHIYPFSLGGPSTIENLRVLCGPCNLAKGASVDG